MYQGLDHNDNNHLQHQRLSSFSRLSKLITHFFKLIFQTELRMVHDTKSSFKHFPSRINHFINHFSSRILRFPTQYYDWYQNHHADTKFFRTHELRILNPRILKFTRVCKSITTDDLDVRISRQNITSILHLDLA